MPSILGQEVGEIGYGLMRMNDPSNKMQSISLTYVPFSHISPIDFTWAAGPPSPEKYTEPMRTALARGSNYWNGGELYGPPEFNSLHMLRDYFRAHPEDADKVVLNIKGGLIPGTLTPDGSKANVDRSINECLRVLDGTKALDVFEAARVDPNHPIEETIGYLAEHVKAGNIKGIGLSHVDAETIRRA